jgi:hypothetical protein
MNETELRFDQVRTIWLSQFPGAHGVDERLLSLTISSVAITPYRGTHDNQPEPPCSFIQKRSQEEERVAVAAGSQARQLATC